MRSQGGADAPLSCVLRTTRLAVPAQAAAHHVRPVEDSPRDGLPVATRVSSSHARVAPSLGERRCPFGPRVLDSPKLMDNNAGDLCLVFGKIPML